MPNEALQKLRSKYPQYNGIPDAELARRVIARYPEYKSALGDVASSPAKKTPSLPSTITGLGRPSLKEVPETINDKYTFEYPMMGAGVGAGPVFPVTREKRTGKIVNPVPLTASVPEVIGKTIRGEKGYEDLQKRKGFLPAAERFAYSLADPGNVAIGAMTPVIGQSLPKVLPVLLGGLGVMQGKEAVRKYQGGDPGGAAFDAVMAGLAAAGAVGTGRRALSSRTVERGTPAEASRLAELLAKAESKPTPAPPAKPPIRRVALKKPAEPTPEQAARTERMIEDAYSEAAKTWDIYDEAGERVVATGGEPLAAVAMARGRKVTPSKKSGAGTAGTSQPPAPVDKVARQSATASAPTTDYQAVAPGPTKPAAPPVLTQPPDIGVYIGSPLLLKMKDGTPRRATYGIDRAGNHVAVDRSTGKIIGKLTEAQVKAGVKRHLEASWDMVQKANAEDPEAAMVAGEEVDTPATPSPEVVSPTQPSAPSVAAKEPWQMSRKEYVAANRSPNLHQKAMAELTHRAYVKQAAKEGKPVPPEVLADYPDYDPIAPPRTPQQIADDLEWVMTDSRQAQARGAAEKIAERLGKGEKVTLGDTNNLPPDVAKTLTAELRKSLRNVDAEIRTTQTSISRKLNKLNSFADPSFLPDLIKLGKLYAEKHGSEWAAKLEADLADPSVRQVMGKIREGVEGVAPALAIGGRGNGNGNRPPDEPAPEPLRPIDPGDIPDRVANMNTKQFGNQRDAIDFMLEAAERNKGKIEEQRRGKVSWEETRRQADALGWTDKEVLRISKGRALNAEQVTRVAQVVTGAAEKARIAAKALEDAPLRDKDAKLLEALAIQAEADALFVKATGTAAEAGRALNAMKMLKRAVEATKTGRQKAVDILRDMYGDEGVPEAMMRRLAEVPENDYRALTAFLRDNQKMTAGDKLSAYRYFNMLSNPKTFVFTNALGNVAQGTLKAGERAISTHPRESLAAAAGSIRGMAEGSKKFLDIMREGFTDTDSATLDLPRGEFRGGLKNPVNVPSRTMRAVDEFFFSIAKQSEMAAQAARGSKGNKAKFRELLDRPTKEMEAAADAYAREATFRLGRDTSTDKLMRLFSQSQKIEGIGPIIKHVVPFARIAAEITRQGVNRTPVVGAMRLATKGGRANARQIATEQASGALLAITGYMAAKSGRVTGAAPEDKEAKATFYASGKKPWSVHVGGRWVSLQYLGPAGFPFVAGAAVNDYTSNKGNLTDKQASNIAAKLGKYGLDQSFLGGFKSGVDALSNERESGTRFLASLGSQYIPASSLLRGVTYTMDPQVRDPDSVLEYWMAQLPKASEKVEPIPGATRKDGAVGALMLNVSKGSR